MIGAKIGQDTFRSKYLATMVFVVASTVLQLGRTIEWFPTLEACTVSSDTESSSSGREEAFKPNPA